jgi:alkylation response protein AidB-like acyl-CoA dehydrogenase
MSDANARSLFNEEHKLFRESVAKFVDKEVAPTAAEFDLRGEFPIDLFRKMGELGYFGIRYPEEYGGSGGDFTSYCIMCEEVSRGNLALGAAAAMQSLMGTDFIFKFGTERQKRKWLEPAIRGEIIGAICMTEPNAGSDLGSIETTAHRDGCYWILNGPKVWVTSGGYASIYTVAAKTSPDAGVKGIDIFIVERNSPGFSIARKIDKLGIRSSDTAELIMQDCKIPMENLMGVKGTGFTNLSALLNQIRTMTGALSLGLARACLDAAKKYASERIAFGKPINRFQAIQSMLADMAVDVEASKMMVYEACRLIDAGAASPEICAMSKLFASEAANRCADLATRIFASYGFSMEFDVQRYFRDARFLLFGGGTSEILRGLIARRL